MTKIGDGCTMSRTTIVVEVGVDGTPDIVQIQLLAHRIADTKELLPKAIKILTALFSFRTELG